MRLLLPLSSAFRNRGLASAAVYGSLVRLAGMALAFLTGLILARLLGKAEFGIYGIVISAGGIAASAALLGAPYLAVREIARSASVNDWAQVRVVMQHLTGAVILVALAGAVVVTATLIFSSRTDAQMTSAAWWVLPFVPAYSLSVLMSSYLRGLDRPVRAQSVEVLFRPLLLLPPILVPMALGWKLDGSSAVGLTAGATFVSLLIGIHWVRQAVPSHSPSRAAAQRGELLRQSLPFAAIDVLRQLEGAYPLLILGMVAANDVAGSFRVGQLGAMLVAVPQTVIGQVLSPTMAKSSGQTINQALLRNAARAMLAISLLSLAVAILVGRPAISLLFGNQYYDAWLPLVILCAVQCVNGFFGLGTTLLILAGEEKPILKIFAIIVPIAILLAFFLAKEFGAAGAAVAVLLGSILSNVLAWRQAASRLGLDTSIFGRELPGPAQP